MRYREQTAENDARRSIRFIDEEVTNEEIAEEIQREAVAMGSPLFKPILKVRREGDLNHDGRNDSEVVASLLVCDAEKDSAGEAEVLGGIADPTGGQVLSSLERVAMALSEVLVDGNTKVRVAPSWPAE